MSSPVATPSTATRRTWILATGVLVFITALLAWDHLIGNEAGSDDFPVDPGTFGLSMALVLALGLLVFGVLVPRALREPARVGRRALVMAGAAVLTAPLLTWLGLPQVLAGGGLVLGIGAWSSGHTRAGAAAIVLSLLVLVFGIAATAFPSDQ